MIVFETTSNVRHASKKRPTSLLTPIPPRMRDFLELDDESSLKWEAKINDKKKYIEISKE